MGGRNEANTIKSTCCKLTNIFAFILTPMSSISLNQKPVSIPFSKNSTQFGAFVLVRMVR